MSSNLSRNLKQASIWKRGLYMLLFAFFYGIAKAVMAAVILIQFLFMLFKAETNSELLKLGRSLSSYMYQIMMFLSFNSEKHPYPFDDWPQDRPLAITNETTAEQSPSD